MVNKVEYMTPAPHENMITLRKEENIIKLQQEKSVLIYLAFAFVSAINVMQDE